MGNLVITQTLLTCRELLCIPHPCSIFFQWPFLPQQRLFFPPGKCRLSSTKWIPPTTRLPGVGWSFYPKKPPSQDCHEKTEKGCCPPPLGQYNILALFCSGCPWHLHSSSSAEKTGRRIIAHFPARQFPAEHQKVQCLSGFDYNFAKEETGKSQLLPYSVLLLCHGNFSVGSSSDPMVIGEGARDCWPGQSLCTNRQQ